MPLVTGVFVMIFGCLTIYLHDPTFIKIKPTIVNTAVRRSPLPAGLYFRQAVLKILLGEVLQMQDEGWRLLTLRWIGFFFCWRSMNEVVWRNFSEDHLGRVQIVRRDAAYDCLFMMSQISLIMKYQISGRIIRKIGSVVHISLYLILYLSVRCMELRLAQSFS